MEMMNTFYCCEAPNTLLPMAHRAHQVSSSSACPKSRATNAEVFLGVSFNSNFAALRELVNVMATLIFQKAGWSVHISRTPRTFAVSFTTALPRRQKSRHLADASDGIRSTRHHNSLPRAHSARTSRHDAARSIFTSTRFYQEQQFQRNATTVRPSSSRFWSSP